MADKRMLEVSSGVFDFGIEYLIDKVIVFHWWD